MTNPTVTTEPQNESGEPGVDENKTERAQKTRTQREVNLKGKS